MMISHFVMYISATDFYFDIKNSFRPINFKIFMPIDIAEKQETTTCD